jgi:hypothetical protein
MLSSPCFLQNLPHVAVVLTFSRYGSTVRTVSSGKSVDPYFPAACLPSTFTFLFSVSDVAMVILEFVFWAISNSVSLYCDDRRFHTAKLLVFRPCAARLVAKAIARGLKSLVSLSAALMFRLPHSQLHGLVEGLVEWPVAGHEEVLLKFLLCHSLDECMGGHPLG